MSVFSWPAFFVMVGLVSLAGGIVAAKAGVPGLREAALGGARLFASVLPMMLLGFLLAGLLQAAVPSNLVVRAIGRESGARGLLIASAAGAVTPGGPFTHFPILAGFMAKGAGVAQVSAYVAAWALLGANRILVWEWPLMGPAFTLARIGACLAVPPLVGWLTGRLHAWLR